MIKTSRYSIENTSPYNVRISELDIQLDRVGYAMDVLTWPNNPPFASDPFYRIYLPVSGCFKLGTLDEEKEIVSGSIYLVPKGQPLRYTGVEPCTHYWCHFYSEKLEEMLNSKNIRKLTLRGTKKQMNRFIRLTELIKEPATPSNTMKIRNITGIIIAEFLDHENNERQLPRVNSDNLNLAAKYIAENYSGKLAISKLAASCNMSSSLFLKKFKKRFGLSPRQYLTGKRLDAAKRILLTSPDISVNEAAYLCGFENTALFFRTFKKKFGCTPLIFRKMRLSKV